MRVEIQIDETCTECKMILVARQLTDEIQMLIQSLSEGPAVYLPGFQNEELILLHPRDILRIYAEEKKTIAETEKGRCIIRLTLQEVQTRLISGSFVRISHSEMINLDKVKHFDLSYSGTIGVTMVNGERTFVSRRYVSKIKQTCGI